MNWQYFCPKIKVSFWAVASVHLLWCQLGRAAVPSHISKPAGDLPSNVAHGLDQDLHGNSVPLEEKSQKVQSKEAPRLKIGSAKSRVIPRAKIAVVESKKPLVATPSPSPLPSPSPSISPIATSQPKAAVVNPKEQSSKALKPPAAVIPEVTPQASGVSVEEIIETTEVYKFAGRDKADPFIPPIGTVGSNTVAALDADEIPIVSPLQYHGVKALVVTGIWQAEDNRWKAMIETPDQQGIIAQNGDPIGNSGGHISEIGSNGVKVREYTLKKDGSRLYSDFVIGMANDAPEEFEPTGGKIVLKPGSSEPEVRKPEVSPSDNTKTDKPADVIVTPQKNEPLDPDAVVPLPIPGVSQLLPTPLPGGTL